MYCTQTYALIRDNEVKNHIVCGHISTASEIAIASYGAGAYAVEATGYPISIGDTYIDGKFYHAGAVVERNPSEAEQIESLVEQLQAMEAQNDTLIECLLEMSEIVYGGTI